MRRMNQYANFSKDALIARILALEKLVNEKLSGQSNVVDGKLLSSESINNKSIKRRSKSAAKQMDFSKFSKRKVAIRFAYLGWTYHGLAFQRDGQKTVESELLKAFHKTKCISSMDPNDCKFSRCGRTDADVSAMAQVVSLEVRSVLTPEEHEIASNDDRELDYLKILNSNLPADILAYQICLRPPPDFDARFSCSGRHYHYYFSPDGLDLDLMQNAADMLVGEHDFRNFCRIDGSKQITNFRRRILSAQICTDEQNGLCYLSIKGTAFLWNQVRSVMAILFLVGQKLESPEIVRQLLDVETFPRRPAYEIAWGIPLVLYDCIFPDMDWKTSNYSSPEKLLTLWHDMLQKQNMAAAMLQVVQPHTQKLNWNSRINIGHGIGKRTAEYTPLHKRPLCETPETVNQKWLDKKNFKEN